ncbi:zinc finger SWIM domain-containing protein 7 [Populus alba x Populus x berolinensis]|uniref:Zinc finger SWIM domain-containing protein 7 n=1 Tax=Populus alba x Populus x berolinensis TaxID=444605 RepID=A0AAD6QCP1_9ROSI|nr:zinc finger SWIM domain-containing protein 7 [Populus alba x Populus x berolinensis]
MYSPGASVGLQVALGELKMELTRLEISETRHSRQMGISGDPRTFSLHFLFGKNLERATKIVDQRGVKKISGQPSGRSIFQVVGESRRKEEYFCFPEHYCACYSFFYDIVNRGEQLCCKHQLAARLAAALGAFIDVNVSDEQLALLLIKL